MSYNLGPVDPDDARAGYPARYGRPRRRLRYVLLAVVALVFAAGAMMLYRGGRHVNMEGGIPLIQADGNPTKRRPDQPGGMTIPNQDKLIYNPGQTQVERLLPPPEQPLPRPVAPPTPEPTVAPAVPAVIPVPSAPPQQAEVTPPPAPIPEPAPVVLAPPVEPKSVPPTTPPAANPPAKPPVVAAAPATVAPPPPRPAPPPPAAAPAPVAAAPPKPATGKGGYKLQIGAVRSTEEAQKEWDRLKKANSDVLGALKADAVRADLGDKGIFYRIQAGTISGEAAAQQACATLKQRKVGCILVPQ